MSKIEFDPLSVVKSIDPSWSDPFSAASVVPGALKEK